MRAAASVMADLAASGLSPDQLALVMELSATVAAEARPAVDRAAENKRAYDREYRKAQRENRTTSHDISDPSPLKVSPQTPLPKTPNRVSPLNPPEIEESQGRWNRMAAKHGLPQVSALRGKRRRALLARADDHGWAAVFQAIDAVANCPHWLGSNGWLGNFDSLMRPDNFQRMLEGAYLSKIEPAANLTHAEQIEMLRRNIPRWEENGRHDAADEARRKIQELERQIAA